MHQTTPLTPAPETMNPDVIRWARETAGLSLEQAAHALALTSPDKLQRIEAGAEPPSRPLLLKMCKAYRRSLLTFYLSAPPRKADRGQDFRTLPPNRADADEALLDALVRDVMTRQNMVRSIVVDDEEGEALGFVGAATINDGAPTVARQIADQLGLKLDEFRAQRSTEQAFAYLRQLAEAQGIFVLLIGNLGSHHSAISVESFRGFAIADRFAPFVVINDQDAKTAWSFTLLHELAHLWLGQTGVSGASTDLAVERFCNEVAASLLLPRDELARLASAHWASDDALIDLIGQFAKTRHVSRKMVAYSLYRFGRLDFGSWQRIDRTLQDLWLSDRQRARERARDSDNGPTYYVVRRHRLGRALLNLVDRTMAAGVLTPVKAAKVLGVKPRSVHPLLRDRLSTGPMLPG